MWCQSCVCMPRAFVKPAPEFRPTKYEQPKINIKYARMLNSGQVLPVIPIDPRISIVDEGRIAIETGKRNLIRADITRSVGDYVLSVIKIGMQEEEEDVEENGDDPSQKSDTS